MAFNLDHTSSGNITLQGANSAFTGVFSFPKPSTTNAIIMTYGAFGTGAISGLYDQLDLKVPTGNIKSAASFNTGITSGTLLTINSDGYVFDSVLPKLVLTKNFVISESSELTMLNDARSGDVATITDFYQSSTYILTGSSYSNTTNWKQLENPTRCINWVNSGLTTSCTGAVCIYGSNLLISSGDYNNSGLFDSIIDLQSGNNELVSTGLMCTGYVKKSDLGSTLTNEYFRTCNLTKCLVNYLTITGLNSVLSGYTTTDNLHTGSSLLDSYVLYSDIGTAGTGWYTGDSPTSYNTGSLLSGLLGTQYDGYFDGNPNWFKTATKKPIINSLIISGGTNTSLTGVYTRIGGSSPEQGTTCFSGDNNLYNITYFSQFPGNESYWRLCGEGNVWYTSTNLLNWTQDFGEEVVSGFVSTSQDTESTLNFSVNRALSNNTSWEWFGYFVPNSTDNYSFCLSADELAYFWIGDKALKGFTTGNVDISGTYGGLQNLSLIQDEAYPIRLQWGHPANPTNLGLSLYYCTQTANVSCYDFYGKAFYSNAPYKFDLLTVGNDGYICQANLPNLALHDTFIISNPMDVTSLVNATTGDIAIDTTNNLNYILTGTYSTLADWVQLSQFDGGVLTVNSQLPDGAGNVTVHTNSISGFAVAENGFCYTGLIPSFSEPNILTNTMNVCSICDDAWLNISMGISSKGHVEVKFKNDTNIYCGTSINNIDNYNFTLVGIWPFNPDGSPFSINYVGYSPAIEDTSVSYKVSDIYNKIDYVSGTYKSSGSLRENLSGYVTQSVFDTILDTKIVTGHVHENVTVLNDFQTCVNAITGFVQSNLINLERSYAVSVTDTNSTTVTGAILLGESSRATVPYSIVHSASHFIDQGDSQSETAISNLITNNDSFNTILDIPICFNTLMFVRSNIIGKNSNGSKYASFTVEGAIAREDMDAFSVEDIDYVIHSRSSSNYCATIAANVNSINVKVKGDSADSMSWTSETQYLSVLGVGADGETVAKYFDGASNAWFDLLHRWFTNANLSNRAMLMPTSASDVYMRGATGACVNLDDVDWVRPHSIDTTQVSDPKGICFVSTTGAVFNGEVFGNASFFGSTFR